MAKKKSIYEVHVWSTVGKGGSVKYHSRLCCTVPKLNVLSTAVHASRQGRSQAVKKLKKLYPGLVFVQLGRKTK
jgi:hypothetical protein